jgi:acyl-[acyl carrier protein]--UDP-N-acetylglucosamine O-acyltransferase
VARVRIFSGSYVGEDCVIGEDTIIYPNCSLMAGTVVGKRVILHAGTVLGSDGFGFAQAAAGMTKFPQIGRTVIEDDVEIGANTTIDRAALGETRVGQGTKIDNLVQLGHNVGWAQLHSRGAGRHRRIDDPGRRGHSGRVRSAWPAISIWATAAASAPSQAWARTSRPGRI